MKILTADAETYYDKTYSLSSSTTEAYIRDPRFEVIMWGIKEDDNETEWFSGTHSQTKKWLKQFDWENSIGLAHNSMFDFGILNWRYDIRPKRIADTLSMARAIDGPDAGNSLKALAERHGLNPKGTEVENALGMRRLDFSPERLRRYADYCCNDVDITYDLFLKFLPLLPVQELELIDLTIRMFTEPVLELDKPLLEKHLKEVREKKASLLDAAGVDKKILMSNPQFAELLRSVGVEPPTKISPTTGKETWAFAKGDEEFRALAEHEDINVQALYAARTGTKSTLAETRAESFIAIGDRGKFPVPLAFYGAHTGRWSGKDKINLQNLPRGSSPLKRSLRAPEGYVLCDADASQIEARIQAWVAEQDDLVEMFRRNDKDIAEGVPKAQRKNDPYKVMGGEVHGISVFDVTDEIRQQGKVALVSAQYGCGWLKLLATAKKDGIKMDEELAQRVISAYRERFHMIPKFWKAGDRALKAMRQGYTALLGREGVLDVGDMEIFTPTGLSLRYPNLRQVYNAEREQYETVYDARRGKATFAKSIWGGGLSENIAQHLARLVIGEHMLEIKKRYRILLTVHDSVVALLPEAEAEEGRAFIEKVLRKEPAWAPGLPLNCETKIGVSYGG